MLLIIPFHAHAAATVFLLGDGGTESSQVAAALASAGHTVIDAGDYTAWDGSSPALSSSVDIVILLNGNNYGSDFQPAGETAITNFIEGGGSFLTTVWTMYDIDDSLKTFLTSYLPVENYTTYGTGDTWTVTQTSHPLVSSLLASWSSSAGWEEISAKTGAQTIITGTDGNPLLVCKDHAAGGVVTYLNHDMVSSVNPIEDDALTILKNAAQLAGGEETITPIRASILDFNQSPVIYSEEINVTE
jgi:hypothetical protein